VNSDGSYYKVNGNWRSAVTLNNMFYTNISKDKLTQVCSFTLSKNGYKLDNYLGYFLADNALSLDYTAWTNDSITLVNNINKIIVFGDSLSDNGNIFNFTQWTIPNQTSYAHGHFSNGKIWSEYLSESIHIPVYTWAIGGAQISLDSKSPLLLETISWNSYKKYAQNYRQENTLFIIWIGANDFLIKDEKSVTKIMSEELDVIENLIKDGSKNILILNVPNTTLAPSFRFRDDGAIVHDRIKQFNSELKKSVESLKVKYESSIHLALYDAYSAHLNIFNNPAKHGLKNISEPCLNVDNNNTMVLIPTKIRETCTDPDTFFSWDNIHPTTAVHKLMAKSIEEFISLNFLLSK
jgi:thermolabile hemolysin